MNIRGGNSVPSTVNKEQSNNSNNETKIQY